MFEFLLEKIFNNSQILVALALLGASSILIRIILVSFGQVWIKTKAHTATLMLIPVITYVITNVISNNIALSLGMVGALSIVRFRNPVRSPLELSTYFAAITMGIAASVSLKWLMILVGSIIIFTGIMALINLIFSKLFLRPFFISSFSEGNSLSTLSVTSKNIINKLEKNHRLISKIKMNDAVTYTLASNDFLELSILDSELKSLKTIISTELRR